MLRSHDNVAEWLRRWIANPLISDRGSSNLPVVELCTLLLTFVLLMFYTFLALPEPQDVLSCLLQYSPTKLNWLLLLLVQFLLTSMSQC